MRSALWGRVAAALICALGSLAQAHGLRDDVRVVLTSTPPPGVVVEVHQDFIGPQIVLGNRSGKTLEILDEQGRAFLRIGPQRAEGDIAAEMFHFSRETAGADLNPRLLSTQPNWRPVNREPSYGWFDPRIAVAPLEIPLAIRQIGEALPFEEWRIPMRFAGKPLELRGVFAYVPPPVGYVQTHLATATPAPGLRVSVSNASTPSLFVHNTGRQTLEVLDDQNQAFLQIGPQGVRVDTASAYWRAAGGITEAARWKTLSKEPSHSWLEPRAAWHGAAPGQATRAGKLGEWRVPLRLGTQTLELRGTHEWVLYPTRKDSR